MSFTVIAQRGRGEEEEEERWEMIQEEKEKKLEEENKNYRLVGLPLYNKASENVFKQSVIESLKIKI